VRYAGLFTKRLVPCGLGEVITGGQTVGISELPACRMGDTFQEETAVKSIAVGLPTVMIGD